MKPRIIPGAVKVLLAAALCSLLLSGCKGSGNVQPTFVPPTTDTPVPSPTLAPNQTPTEVPTPSPTQMPITPVPAGTKVDGTDFFEVMRLLGQGTQVKTEGASAQDIKRCFFAEELSAPEKEAFQKAGFGSEEIADMYKIRVLYYRSNGNVYIGELFVKKDYAAFMVRLFTDAFDKKTQITDLSDDFSDEFFSQAGFDTVGIVNGRHEYLYLKKQ